MQPRVVADDSARTGFLFQIGRDTVIDQVADFEYTRIHLISHLQGVAAIDKDRRLLLKNHCRTRRACEAGGPGQTFVARRQIFVLIFIRVRHDPGVHALAFHRLANQRHVARAEGRVSGLLEALHHGALHSTIRSVQW